MTTQRMVEKITRIQTLLDSLYPATPVPLDHTSPFTLLIAVLLSAQTTDKKVNEVTPALFARAKTPVEMAMVPVDEIRDLIRQIGLAPTKAKNIQRLSEMLRDQFGGEVPADQDALESLPGVGHKTAQVVMAQAFGVPSFPVDTHIHRLATRWGLSNGKNVDQTERDLKALFPKAHWNKLHLQIIFFGREYCPARFHDLSTCPICAFAATKARIAAEAKLLPATMTGKKPPKKATANKATANKATANKATAKKTTAKKTTAKKTTAKKTTANKTTANKASAKKTTANKASANKASANKAAIAVDAERRR